MSASLLNPVVIKKWIVLIVLPLFAVVFYHLGMIYFGFWWTLVLLMGVLVIFGLIGTAMLRTPLRDLEEGAGVLLLDWTSKGILKPVIVNLFGKNVIRGKLGANTITEVFDRECVQYLQNPIKAKNPVHYFSNEGKNYMGIILEESEYNNDKFVLNNYSCLIYNSMIGTIVNKQGLADQEKNYAAEHLILYIKQVVEQLTSMVMDFSRASVDSILKPKGKGFGGNWWVWVIIILVIVIVVWFAWPYIKGALGGATQAVAGAVQTVPNQAPPV